MKYLVSSIIFALLSGAISVIARTETPASRRTLVQTDAILAIEVFVRPKTGRQPAANAKFYLLDTEVETILRDAGLEPIAPWDNLEDTYTMALEHSSHQKELYRQRYQPFREAADKAIKPHIIAMTVTDKSGKGSFNPVKPGRVYLFGVALTKKGASALRSEIDLIAGANTFQALREKF